jgi:hypothetical protein
VDFITDLPDSTYLGHTFDAIMVVTCHLTKLCHFIPATKTFTAADTADSFIDFVFKLHGLPDKVISDRGPQFVAAFWECFLKRLKITRALSTAFHPETDGQTERVNSVLEQYLRCFVDYLQSNWATLLPQAEFAYNNSYHSAIRRSPFYATFGFNPRMDFLPVSDISVPFADARIREIQDTQELLKHELVQAKESAKRFADRSRLPAPMFSVGDFVWLSRKNIKTLRPASKLDFKRLGPFKITQKISDIVFKLQLPEQMKIHPVFHVSLLESAHAPTAAPVILNSDSVDSSVKKLKAILNARLRVVKGKKILQYLVQWDGQSMSDAVWESASVLGPYASEVRAFHVSYPDLPMHYRVSLPNPTQSASR